MKPLINCFSKAIQDYVYLLERSYPPKTILNLVGTRYSLSATERSMLYRGVSPSAEAKKRKEKKISPAEIEGAEKIHIDTLNVLMTLHAYLAGQPVYISTDGFVRDAAEAHGNPDLPHLARSVEMLTVFLERKGIKECTFYLDRKADNTTLALKILDKELKKTSFDHEIIVSNETDKRIEKARDGFAATSDSTIIDRTPLLVADLPEGILAENFTPDLISLQDIL